jgi:hypothetical protein
LVSQSDFARAIGIGKHAVGAAIKAGRLSKSVTIDENGTPKINDIELAKREWAANTDTSMVRRAENVDAALARSGNRWVDVTAPLPGDDVAPPVDEGMSPAQRKAHWEALTKELEFRQAAKELVSAAEVERSFTETFTVCKTKLLAIPSRAKQEAPDLTLAHLALLERLIREACEALAVGG